MANPTASNKTAVPKCRECGQPRPGLPVMVTYTGEAEDSNDDCDVSMLSPDYGVTEAARTTHSCRGFDCVNKAILRLVGAHDSAIKEPMS